jgi:hypothetical protein
LSRDRAAALSAGVPKYSKPRAALQRRQQLTRKRGQTCYITHILVVRAPPPERIVFTLLLILIVVGISLGVGLFVVGLFVQGYIYTEPSPKLTWGAPVAGAILFFFYSLWCLLVVYSAATPGDIPYDVAWRFSPRVDMFSTPAKDVWAVRKGGKQEHYVAKKFVRGYGVPAGYEYRSADTDRPWNGTGVEAIILRPNDQELRFDRVPEKQREQGAYQEFVSSDGWRMTEYDSGPTGIPSRYRTDRFLANLLLNFLHLGLWFVCLWLLMRFLWSHALVGAFVLWLVSTLIVLPMLLSYAAEVSQSRQPPAPLGQKTAHHAFSDTQISSLSFRAYMQPPANAGCDQTTSRPRENSVGSITWARSISV